MQLNGTSGRMAEFAVMAHERSALAAPTKEAKAAQQFEELFATQLVSAMRKTLPEGFFGKGSGSDIYESWLDQHIGSALARDNALGIAGVLKASWSTRTEGPTQ